MSCLLSHLVGVRQPGKPSIQGHPPRYRPVSTHYIGYPRNCTAPGLWASVAALIKSTMVIFELLKAILQSRRQRPTPQGK